MRSIRRLASILLLTVAVVTTSGALPAFAHGDGETEIGYVLVEQALGHLAHDTSAEGIGLAMEKVNDALETDEQGGMSVPEVEQAMAALEAGDATGARTLLQDSIKEALSMQPPATGNETGTTRIVPELPGRASFGAQEWLFLVVSVVLLLTGSWLAYVFRPHESIGVLRSLLGPPPAPRRHAAPNRENR